MYRFYLFISMLLITAISACSSVKVSHDYDLDKALPLMQTYRWEMAAQPKTGDVRVDNPLLNARIRKSVDRVFSKKGFQKVSAGEPDFMVAYQFSISSKIRSDDLRTGVGFGMESYGRHGGVAISSGSTITQYDEGLLVIDFTDVKSGDLLWRGNGTRRLPAHTDPEQAEKISNELVEKILEQFPPEDK